MISQKTIIIGFSKPKKWKLFAKLIMIGYGKPYDHVYFKVHSDKYDRDLIYQASHLMVNFMGLAVFESENIIVKEFVLELSENSRDKVMKFAIDNVGKPYDIKGVFGLAIVRFFELLGKKIKNPFKSTGSSYYCSELVAQILSDMGENIQGDISDLSPRDIYYYVTNLLKQADNDKDLRQ
jgi:uncharacterized protein YycO